MNAHPLAADSSALLLNNMKVRVGMSFARPSPGTLTAEHKRTRIRPTIAPYLVTYLIVGISY